MSKFTTEVRYICENACGLTESKGANSVDEIVSNARTHIFDFNYPIYDEAYRSVLEIKILKHFYTREIGLETVGLWKLKLNTKMNEIMPYYNQLYKSTLLEFNPLWTDDYSTTHNRRVDSINEKEEAFSGTVKNDETALNSTKNKEILSQDKTFEGVVNDNGETITGNTKRDRYADTPQGALTDLEADRYLTNARKITDDGTTNISNSRLDTNEESTSGNRDNTSDSTNLKTTNNLIDNNAIGVNTFNNTEDYLEYVQGRRGKDVSDMLIKYRKTFLNIDMQVIDELEELFLHLW